MIANDNSTNNFDNSNARLLLADDDPRMLESLSTLLKLYDYQVDTALGGKNAIKKLTENQYDLLLLDLKMPEVSGHDVMRYMTEKNISTMTIVVSGGTSLDDISMALRQGAYDYLKKPYIPEELTSTVKNAVRKKRLENANQIMQMRLNRSEKLHRFIVNSSPDIIFMLDKQGCFSFLNSKIEALLDYTRESLIGRPISSLVEDDDKDKISYLLERALAPNSATQTIDVSIKPNDLSKNKRFFEISLWKIDSETGNTHFDPSQHHTVYGTARDITERMEAEAFINWKGKEEQLELAL